MCESANGSVTGQPKLWLRSDGLVMLIASLILFATTNKPWWLVPVIIFLPDLFMVGYLKNTRIGSWTYNAGHSYVLPTVLSLVSLKNDSSTSLALSLLWFAHIGMDRVFGYGLKYPNSFKNTHLGSLDQSRRQ